MCGIVMAEIDDLAARAEAPAPEAVASSPLRTESDATVFDAQKVSTSRCAARALRGSRQCSAAAKRSDQPMYGAPRGIISGARILRFVRERTQLVCTARRLTNRLRNEPNEHRLAQPRR